MTIRSISTDLKNSLLPDNPSYQEGFSYAHLIKFEKAIKTGTGKTKKTPLSYAYITDASRNIRFNDGSTDINGTPNGLQTYIANRVVSVGSVQETTEARASNFNIEIDTTALGTSLSNQTFIYSTSTIIGEIDFVDAGFAEGDKLKITASNSLNTGLTFRINSFTNNNKTINFSTEDTVVTGTGTAETVEFASEEVIGLLNKKEDSASYAGYINREIFIYKAHIDTDTGSIIGDPYLLFKGIISNAKLTEDPSSSSKISWGVSSHWGDFVRVNGRITSDDFHRGLDGNGQSDPYALKRPEYADDLGFMHSEQAINIIGIYQVSETRYKLKSKRKWYGTKKYKQVEYQVQVDREADLRFNLDAKYIPVVYGVQKIDAIPFFVDTDKDSADIIYVAYALCEGEIGGLYDIYFDSSSSICLDEQDNDTRAQGSEGVDVYCQGRMDRGDVLAGYSGAYDNLATTLSTLSQAYAYTTENGTGTYSQEVAQQQTDLLLANPLLQATTQSILPSSQSFGLQHEEATLFEKPLDTRMVFHSGKPNQKTDGMLASIANQSRFKIQTDYFSSTADYWGANHRVLDTAYVATKFTISDGETTIPELDFIVRGKLIDCYNYDFSYVSIPAAGESISNFNLGDSVNIYDISDPTGTTSLGSNIIADIFTLPEENEPRIRLKTDPDLSITAFYIKNSNGDTWRVITYDHVEQSGNVAETLTEQVQSISTGTTSGVSVNINAGTVANILSEPAIQAAVAIASQLVGVERTYEEEPKDALVPSRTIISSDSTNSGQTLDNVGVDTDITRSETVFEEVQVKNAIKLDTVGKADDFYNGFEIQVTRRNDDDTLTTETKTIIDFDGATQVAIIDGEFNLFLPRDGSISGTVADTYKILTKKDRRVSINPAMQLLDYITNNRYGKDLSIEEDINLDAFRRAALACDTRSDVTVVTSSTPTIGADYEYVTGGVRIFRATC